MNRTIKAISWASGLLVTLLAIGAFALSYNALYAVSLAYGVPVSLAWLWPLLVDGAIVVFSLAVVRAHLMKESTVQYWALTIVFTMATMVFNIVHSSLTALSVTVAIVAPIALVLSFEALMSMLKSSVLRSSLVESLADLARKLEAKRQELDRLAREKMGEVASVQLDLDNLVQWYDQQKGQLENEIVTMKRTIESYRQDIEVKKEELKRLDLGQFRFYVPGNLTIEQRQELVNRMAGDGLTNELIAEALGVSVGTIKNDKRLAKELNGKH